MRPSRALIPVALGTAALLGLPAGLVADSVEPRTSGGLAGRVVGEEEPLSSATVYAYQLADLSLRKAVTNQEGRFLFEDLPAGLYQIVAHRSGFVPAMTVISRVSAAARQFLELQLTTEAEQGLEPGVEEFWSLRQRMPADVLRDLQLAELANELPPEAQDRPVRFETEMQAMTGVDSSTPVGDMALAGGRVGVRGTLGDVAVDVRGDLLRMGLPVASLSESQGGLVSSVSVRVEGPQETQIDLQTRSDRLFGFHEGEVAPVDYEQVRVGWSQVLGERLHSEVSAHYVSETNFFRQTWTDPVHAPDASKRWRVEAALSGVLNDRAGWRAGMRYRVFDGTSRALERGPDYGLEPLALQHVVSLFGEGTWTLLPSVLLEYGLTTTLRDGDTILIPDVGVVLQLSSSWQLAGAVSHRLRDDSERLGRELLPVFISELDHCDQVDAYCYRAFASRETGDDNRIQVGAVHRQFAETLRLFFSDNPLNRSDSLYLVPGDEVPEIQVTVVRRLSPNVLTKLESHIGRGGGGVFLAANHHRYENSVRYLLASLDTHFRPTATAIAIAFHLLEQELRTLHGVGGGSPPDSLERLQILLNQDLNVLLDLRADWALLLNVELARGGLQGGSPLTANDETRRRLMGGVAVRF